MQVVECSLQVGLARQGGQLGLGAVAQRVVAVAQGVALAGLCVGGSLRHEVAHQVIFERGGVQGLEVEIGLTSACFPGFLLWF